MGRSHKSSRWSDIRRRQKLKCLGTTHALIILPLATGTIWARTGCVTADRLCRHSGNEQERRKGSPPKPVRSCIAHCYLLSAGKVSTPSLFTAVNKSGLVQALSVTKKSENLGAMPEIAFIMDPRPRGNCGLGTPDLVSSCTLLRITD